MSQHEIYSSLPIALIYTLERAEPKLAKFILSCDDNDNNHDSNNLKIIDRRKYKPSHLVLLLKYHHCHEYSFGGVALLELNRIGVELKSPPPNKENDDGGRLIRINDVNGKPLGLFADEQSVNTTHPVVISEWNECEMIFSQSIDSSSKSFVKFKLNQKKVEESHVERVEIEVSHQIYEKLYRAENHLQVPTIGRAQNVLLPVVSFDISTKKVCLGLFNIEKQFKEKALYHSLKVSEKFSTEEADYASYIALMESNLGQKYILKYSSINAAHSSVGVLELNNPSLLKKIKRNSSSNTIIQQTSKSKSATSVMIPIMKEDLINKEVTMRSFNPFFNSNPDIFQVLVFFSKMVENGVDFNPHHGKMFSFFFKFKNEAKVKLRKVGRRFSDVTIITCSKSKVGSSSNRQFTSYQMNNH